MRWKPASFVFWTGIWFWSGAGLVHAHSLQVYSELQRIDPFGNVVTADTGKMRPREILSPAVARNAFASFHLAVSPSGGKSFTLYVAQNPEDLLRVTVYKEIYTKCGNSWIPDRLEVVRLSYSTKLPDPANPIPNQTTVTFWMDLWVPSEAHVERIKVEPQIYAGGDWITYPMEVRVIAPVIPKPPRATAAVAAVEEPADVTVRGVLRSYLCGLQLKSPARESTVRHMILRNALQDMALARALEKTFGRNGVSSRLLKLIRSDDPQAWCQAPSYPRELGAEWYLRVRDSLYRMLH